MSQNSTTPELVRGKTVCTPINAQRRVSIYTNTANRQGLYRVGQKSDTARTM